MPNWKDWDDKMVAEWTTDPKRGDKGNYTVKDGVTYFPIWKNSLQGGISNLTNQLGNAPNPNETPGGFKGVDYNFFTNLLKGYMEQGDPNTALYRQNVQKGVNKSFDKANQSFKERLASSGLLRSGAASAGMIDLEAGRAGAMADAEVGLAAQDQSFRGQALTKLLGLQELGLNELNSNRSYGLNLQSILNNLLMGQKQFDFMNEQSKFNFFRDMLPGLINAGGQMIGAGIFSSKSNTGSEGNWSSGFDLDKWKKEFNSTADYLTGRPWSLRG